MLLDFLKPKTALGLDISELSIRMMQLSPLGKGFFPMAYSDEPISPGFIADDKIINPDKVAEIIAKCKNNPAYGHFDTNYAVISVPEAKSFVRVITVPKMSREEAGEAIPFEAEQYIPIDINQVYLDFKIIPDTLSKMANEKMRVVIYACPKNLVDGYLAAVKLARLHPVGVEVESEALARSLISSEYAQTPTLIIDLSSSRTNLIIYDQGALHFTSSLPLGGNSFTTQLSQRLTVSLEEAEKIKRQSGFLSTKAGPGVKAAIQPLMDNLLEAVRNTMNFYREHSDSSRQINRLVISGGGGKIKGFADYISQKMRADPKNSSLEVVLGDPWKNIIEQPMKKIPPISRSDSISYSTVLGLALRGVEID